MLVVIASMVLLAYFGLPAVNTFLKSFQSPGSTKAMISAALASARAIAAKEQRYAGIRFQKAYNPDDPLNPLSADQYMVFVVQDPDISAWGFRAVEGPRPIKLPETIGVMDFAIVTDRNAQNPVNPSEEIILDDPGSLLTDDDKDILLSLPERVRDTTAFSIVFSPSGRLVIHGIRITTTGANDDIFNTQAAVEGGTGMFFADDYNNLGLGPEPSRNSFVIYDRKLFREAYENNLAWSAYLIQLVPEKVYINPYTGTTISKD